MHRLPAALILALTMLLILLIAPAVSPRRHVTPDIRYLGPSMTPYAERFPGLVDLTQAQMDHWVWAQQHQGIEHLP